MAEAGKTSEEWLARLGPALVLLAHQWTASPADAEDAVQEAFVRFWRSGRHRAENPKAYLFACVKRAALDLRRSETRRRRREIAAAPAAAQALFETSPERDEWRVVVEAGIAVLPVEQREVLVMKVWGGLTFPQIGAALGVSPNTAASRCRYALAALRRRLSGKDQP